MPGHDAYDFLLNRKSAVILTEPSPDAATIERILRVAGTVPDHGALRPYRFVVVQGSGRARFAAAMVDAAEAAKGPLEDKARAKIRAKADAAPVQIVVIFSPVESGKIPTWEQMAAACCTGYALGLAANSLGFGAVWKSFAFDPGRLMQTSFLLQAQERVLGWVNIGTEKERDRSPRTPLDLAKHALFLTS